MRQVTFMGLFFLASLPRVAGAFDLEDGLRGGTLGNAIGGTFDADGFHITDRTDRIWYALPRLATGSVEFTLSGVTMETLVLGDHEVFALYEAGYGMAEPINYDPEFRNNHYKCMLRIYGQAEPNRAGAQKLMWGMCPSGAPGHDACGCNSFFEEPFGGNPEWNGAATRFRVEWGDGRTRLLRDGVEAVGVDWSGSGLAFGPSELHLTLGSPRSVAVGDAGMPIGAVLSDLVIHGTEGPLATCEGPVAVPDGALPPPADGGAPADHAGLVPTDDLTVIRDAPGGVGGDGNDLSVGTYGELAYLRFEVPRPVSRAVLRLNARSDGSAAGDGAFVHAVLNTNFTEETLTFANRPVEVNEVLGRTGPTVPDGVYDVDVTAAVLGAGPVAFALKGRDNGSHFSSKEDVRGTRTPLLLVTYTDDVPLDPDANADDQPPPRADGSPGDDVSRRLGDVGLPGNDSFFTPTGDALASTSAAPADGVNDCGCSQGRQSTSATLLVVLLALRRRRRPIQGVKATAEAAPGSRQAY